ncbi:MAG: lanthionine synthetase LanC family protein [Candidatus Aminicenantales bacterium]
MNKRIVLSLIGAGVFWAAIEFAASAPASVEHFTPALGAALWLDSAALKTAAGLAWPTDPKDPKSVNSTLYAGTPGVVLFYLEARAAAQARNLAAAVVEGMTAKAKGGADELLARLDDEMGVGLYEGLGGIAFTLEETYKATGEARYRQGFRKCLDIIRMKARPSGKGIQWSPSNDIISGSAGAGLCLLYAAGELGDKTLIDLAARAGDRLIELGRARNGGLDWAMDPDFPRTMPNFSHGTAGVAFFLVRLYGATGNRAYLKAALAGAKYLLSIAKTDGDACLIFHDEPDNKDLYYLGWCHGPVGTANLFYSLFKETGDPVWMDWVRREANALVESGIPEKETPGFWNNAGLCCGLAGVADFFLNLYKAARDPVYVAFFNRIMNRLLDKATVDGDKLSWIQAEHRTQPKLLMAQTGLMQGAAGIGLVFLRRDGFEMGRAPLIRMPDSAFFDRK